jgi:hypothetical protein
MSLLGFSFADRWRKIFTFHPNALRHISKILFRKLHELLRNVIDWDEAKLSHPASQFLAITSCTDSNAAADIQDLHTSDM